MKDEFFYNGVNKERDIRKMEGGRKWNRLQSGKKRKAGG